MVSLTTGDQRQVQRCSPGDPSLKCVRQYLLCQAVGAGYLEGWVTAEMIYYQYLNTIVGRCDGKQELCDKISGWVVNNTVWVTEQLILKR